MCDYILIHGLHTLVWQDDQGLGRNVIGKLVTREFGEVVCGKKQIVSYVNAHQRVNSAEEDNNHQVTHSVDMNQPFLSPATSVIT